VKGLLETLIEGPGKVPDGTKRHEKSPVLRGLHHFTGLSWTASNLEMVGRRQSNCIKILF
jgi:hypothetical protein